MIDQISTEAIPYVVSVPLILAGFAGSVFPALPGVVLVWAGMFAFFLLDHSHRLDTFFILTQAGLAASTYAADYMITIWGVRKFDGSKAAAWGAVLGSLLIFVIGPIGIVVGPLAGAIVGDLIAGQALKQAFRSGFGSFIGFLFAMIYRLLICGIMVSWFVLKLAFS